MRCQWFLLASATPTALADVPPTSSRARPLINEEAYVVCCRFRSHEEKIVIMKLESGCAEMEVQARVQDRGCEAGDGAWCVGHPSLPGPGTGRERPAPLEAGGSLGSALSASQRGPAADEPAKIPAAE